MWEYVLKRVHYNRKKKCWEEDEEIGIFGSLDEALNAQAYDQIIRNTHYQYYIEHRIKLDYGTGINTI